jgi:DNA-binding NarL/FixJ family response regulator
MSRIKVLIVDDVSRVRQDLSTFLTLAGNIEIIGEADQGEKAIQQTVTLQPDVVLMDLEMPVLDGLEATRRIKTVLPDCRVIVLTIHGDKATQNQALSAGADYFLEKGVPLNMLLDAIFAKNLAE